MVGYIRKKTTLFSHPCIQRRQHSPTHSSGNIQNRTWLLICHVFKPLLIQRMELKKKKKDDLLVVLFLLILLITDDIFLGLLGCHLLVIFCFSLSWFFKFLWKTKSTNTLSLSQLVLFWNTRLMMREFYSCSVSLEDDEAFKPPTLSCTALPPVCTWWMVHLPHHCPTSWLSSTSGSCRHPSPRRCHRRSRFLPLALLDERKNVYKKYVFI